MTWNWQRTNWPHFKWDPEALTSLETRLLHDSGLTFGAFEHLTLDDQHRLTIELVSNEALNTSAIEGEVLDRSSVQASLRRELGLGHSGAKVRPAEQGIAEMMTDLYRHFADPLTADTLFAWHKALMRGRKDLKSIGAYRRHEDPMQIVSGYVHQPKIHFEAPPSRRVPAEMKAFLSWFNQASTRNLPLLTRAGITHLYFESIHPFEDGNGRIGRALSEKALAQGLNRPTLFVLSQGIEAHKKDYYRHLESASRGLTITDWLVWFGETILEAGTLTRRWVSFLVAKAKFFSRLASHLNPRQEKVLARMFQEGPSGFKGGLSAHNYTTITRASPATTTRDLQALVEIGALKRTGELRYTRYWLNLEPDGFSLTQ